MLNRLNKLKELLNEEVAELTKEDIGKLLLAVCLVVYADGEMQDDERLFVASMCKGLPELKKLNSSQVSQMIVESVNALKPYHDRLGAVRAFEGIQSERVKKKCFLLALEAALVNGSIGPMEIRLLERLFEILNLSDSFAQQAAEIITLKYR